ncbi:nuclear transport factor 2 family protein [Streptomyces sp. NRRL F-5527]|uniref:nuclear transport factor 2 family protein n=1 Tax=Streptomyces sp. NRRL F-5527 TaxID=1463862 RepID=UPI00056B316F|nr:nuclear transport factor 2 family protein [Streptomyces sp. NRRL F-5527]
MTQRVELATVRDRLALDGLVTDYAVAVDDGDWAAYRRLFTADGRADYRGAGGIEGDAGDTAEVRADYVSPASRGGEADGAGGLDLLSGGRCLFTTVRTPDGWRLSRVVVDERWRSPTGGRADDVID